MDWNEYNRELQNRISDPNMRYMLGLQYERLLDMAKQIDANNEILLAIVNTIQNLVGLNEALEGKMQNLNKIIRGHTDGVELESVPITNDDLDS
jgi:hypothetical protein